MCSFAQADDRFAIALSAHDNLVIFGPKGDRIAELSIPTISQSVTAGNTAFQISYGRDANNYITAILAPSANQPQALHFTVLNKSVDADKSAVVTLTFTGSNRVLVDPGYIGSVSVNSVPLHARSLADSAPIAPPPPPAPIYQPAPAPATPQPQVRPVANLQPRTLQPYSSQEPPPRKSVPVPSQPTPPPAVSHQAPSPVAPLAPKPIASTLPDATSHANEDNGIVLNPSDASGGSPLPQPPPLLGSAFSQPVPLPPLPGASTVPLPSKKLFWAEPVTPPSGKPPTVGIDEMKLVAVHGPVTLKLPDGNTKPAANGMIIPSGTSISTGEHASAAVFMGGVDSVRLNPSTQAKISQSLEGDHRKTSINLRNGAIFNRVGHRQGEQQDYQVVTPQGVAAARGTNYAVAVTNVAGQQVTIAVTEEGVVTLTDSTTGHQITITPEANGVVSIGSVPKLPLSLLTQVFVAVLLDLQQFNTTMQAIANNPNPTPAELAYYNSNASFYKDTLIYDVNDGRLAALFDNVTRNPWINTANPINYVIPGARRATDQLLQPFGTVPLTPF